MTLATSFYPTAYDSRFLFKWSKWINPIKTFKNLTITPLPSILIILVLSNVPGATYWSNSILDKSYYSSPLKFIGIYYSEDKVTLMIFLFYSISFTTTIICLSYTNYLYCYSDTFDFGKKTLYFCIPYTDKWQPSYYLDFIWAGNVWPIFIDF